MLTRPTLFTNAHQRDGQELHTVISITDGVTTWYIADKDMQLGATHIHGILQKHSGINERIDLMTKRWAVSNVTIQIANGYYKKSSTCGDVRFSDEIGDIYGKAFKVYLVAGGQTTSLTDWLLRFSGIVSKQPKYTSEAITIVASDLSKIKDVMLPKSLIGDTYAGAPADNLARHIPIVYGEFTKNLDGDDTGLAITECIQNSVPPKYVISDHVIDAITKLWVQVEQFPEQTEFEDLTTSVDDSGKGTGQVDAGGIGWYGVDDTEVRTWLFPKDNYTGEYDISAFSESITNFPLAVDKNSDTFAEVTDAVDTGTFGASYQEIYAAFTLDDYASGSEFVNEIGPIIATSVGFDTAITFQYKIDYPTGLVAGDWQTEPEIRLYYTMSGGADVYALEETLTVDGTAQAATLSYVTDPPDWNSDICWHPRIGSIDNADTEKMPATFVIYGKTEITTNMPVSGDFDADGVVENVTLLKIYDIRLEFRHRLKNSQWDNNQVFAECAGYEYDSWITSRSSNYADGDCIVDPAGIIESLLRNEMGFATGDIDLPSFISAENTSVEARINIHDGNDGYGFDFIQQIVEQSTFAFFFGAVGKAKLINMADSSPTTNVTIPFSHIKNGKINVKKSEYIYNEMELHSQYQQEYDSNFANVQTVENTTSQAENWGTRKYTSKWQNVSGTSALHVANHLIRSADGTAADDDGLWAEPHVEIELETAGFLYSHLELGDWIELDDATLDSQVLCYGASWSGKQFCIQQLSNGLYGTKIKAIELFG